LIHRKCGRSLVTLNLHLGPLNGVLWVCASIFDKDFYRQTILIHRPQSSTPLKQEKQPQSYGAASQPFGPPPPRPPGITAFPVNVFPPKEKSVAIISGLAIGLVVVLLQTVLMFAHVDALKPFLDIESAKRHVSIENSTLAVEKEKMEHETEVMTREKELWEQAREARVPHGAFWEDVWPAWDCRAYGKREYWGVLRDIPEGWSNIDACMNMPVEIKGVTVRRPYRCGYVWGSLQIHGYWMVDWDQPDCKPWHRDYKDAVRPSYSFFLPTYLSLHAVGCAGVYELQVRQTKNRSSNRGYKQQERTRLAATVQQHTFGLEPDHVYESYPL